MFLVGSYGKSFCLLLCSTLPILTLFSLVLKLIEVRISIQKVLILTTSNTESSHVPSTICMSLELVFSFTAK